ncbi:glycosyltransferase family 2 protein [Vibrio mediterranei]|uniref:Glycosyltransferase 2-like domain-containing protein n=1 Tax=Vibrio mediterranei TaxID=689 RepID=A0AAN1KMD9_9VIBR|nr:glycosyltransferase family 2 protein [Vibrio mediterranei]ASI89217.1 hypothetical protein BSZ05_05020 [Vibrio mediterranei]
MEKLDCSVIMPVYNDIDIINLVVARISRISEKVNEVIVVDDSSSDGSFEHLSNSVASRLSNVRVLRTPRNGGPSIARNLGIDNATSRYIAFLDSDDDWHTEKLEYQIATMEEHCAYFSGTEHLVVTPEQFIESSVRPISSFKVTEVKWPWVLFRSPFSTPSVVIRRDVKGLKFSPNLRFAEDFNLWLRICLRYKSIKLHEGLTYTFKHDYISSGASLSSQLVKMEVGELLGFFDLMKIPNLGWRQRFLLCVATVFSVMKFSVRVLRKMICKVRS